MRRCARPSAANGRMPAHWSAARPAIGPAPDTYGAPSLPRRCGLAFSCANNLDVQDKGTILNGTGSWLCPLIAHHIERWFSVGQVGVTSNRPIRGTGDLDVLFGILLLIHKNLKARSDAIGHGFPAILGGEVILLCQGNGRRR